MNINKSRRYNIASSCYVAIAKGDNVVHNLRVLCEQAKRAHDVDDDVVPTLFTAAFYYCLAEEHREAAIEVFRDYCAFLQSKK